MARGWGGYGFRPYVPVARRRAMARKHVAKLSKSGHVACPVHIEGTKIAKTFWGKAWCDNLESYSDYANRLPRGRTYVRNGSVVDLQISRGRIEAIVSGSDIYEIGINIKSLPASQWKCIQQDCAQSIHSLIDLLQGRFSSGVMQRLTRQGDGLFPRPREITLRCSCPDSAVLCKHVAAVLYGVGARLDTDPQLLFQLREVDHLELIHQAVSSSNLDEALRSDVSQELQGQDLGALFGIELATENHSSEPVEPRRPARSKAKTNSKSSPPPVEKKAGRSAKTKRMPKRPTSESSAAPLAESLATPAAAAAPKSKRTPAKKSTGNTRKRAAASTARSAKRKTSGRSAQSR